MHRVSYWKTVAVAIAISVSSLLAVVWLHSARSVAQPFAVIAYLLAVAVLLAASLVLSGGLLCLWRDARETSGRRDLFAPLANEVPDPGLVSRLGLRSLLGPDLRPGDIVQVKSRREIETTLDAAGTLGGLPFMREMEVYCGRTFRVHRNVDKINDMRHKTGLRRMRSAVTLTGVRCSGSHHGGCEAECQLLWKDSWLKKLPAARLVAPHPDTSSAPTSRPERDAEGDSREYVCQMTQLWEASCPMSYFDVRQDLRPLLTGNLGVGGYAVAVLTRIFNRVQRARGGVGYPFMPQSSVAGRTPSASLGLKTNDVVMIRRKEEIAPTLVDGRNRGLWFDREMIRYCGQAAVVRKRVSRVIHEATRRMVTMKTPCVVLEDVIATGEFLRLCPQHEYIFWREIWLKRPEKGQQHVSDQGS
jgi:hypothetical protein